MTVAELTKILADFNPLAEVRIKPSLDSCGDGIKNVHRANLGSRIFVEDVIIERELQ